MPRGVLDLNNIQEILKSAVILLLAGYCGSREELGRISGWPRVYSEKLERARKPAKCVKKAEAGIIAEHAGSSS